MTAHLIDPKQFRQVMGCYPTGVCAITANDKEGRPLALVVGSFTSVSLDPPLVGFLPDKSSSTWPLIAEVGQFCVNVLASDQTDVCRQLATGPDKFAGLEVTSSEYGHPVIANSIVQIDCTLDSVLEAGDHWFVLGKVLKLESTRDDNPMIFHRGKYGGFAE